MRRIAVYGGSFNPPGLHHRRIVEALIPHFDEIVVIPCGPRPDKPTTNDVDSVFRAAMTDLGFRGLPKVTIDLSDLEQAVFSHTDELEKKYAQFGEVWLVVGADLIEGGKDNHSPIQRFWQSGKGLWKSSRFAVMVRENESYEEADLPPHGRAFRTSNHSESSADIRETVYLRKPFAHLVHPEVASYIERYGLYRGRIPSRVTRLSLREPRLIVYADPRNPKSQTVVERLRPHIDESNPNCVVAVGGDGTMLDAIRAHWTKRLPFFGINTGHLGFLLNNLEEVFENGFPPEEMILHQMPLLYVEADGPDGITTCTVSFNDAWVERNGSQSAWVEVKVNNEVRIPKLVGDGILLSTAAGSTAYARAMGAPPLLADTPALVLAGSNIMSPTNWKFALISLDAEVEFRTLDPVKRPLIGYAGGMSLGEVHRMRIRASRIATVELSFSPQHDMAEKIMKVQFPVPSSIL